jgi:hypothetical protein
MKTKCFQKTNINEEPTTKFYFSEVLYSFLLLSSHSVLKKPFVNRTNLFVRKKEMNEENIFNVTDRSDFIIEINLYNNI